MQRGDGKKGRAGRRRLFVLAAVVLLWAVPAWWFIFPPSPALVETIFTRKWYRGLLSFILPITEPIRLPLAPVILSAGACVFLALWMRQWIRADSRLQALAWGGRRLAVILPVLAIWFIGFWGAGYRRMPIEQRLQLNTSPISVSEARDLEQMLLLEIKRSMIPESERNPYRAVDSIAESMGKLTAAWDGKPIRLPHCVKKLPGGLLLSNGTSGMCAPFTLEPLVDSSLPPAAFVSSAAHELGHVAGICAEDEATFAGYAAGLQAEEAFARYACALSAFVDLVSSRSEDERKRALAALPEIARLDLKAAEDAYRKHRIRWLEQISRHAYDRYLRSQGVPDGIRSYSRGITLLAFARRSGIISAR